jgi:uncharacterized membrane protein YhaH (DUF805 family)
MFKGHFAGTALIFCGIFLLLDNLGILQFNLIDIIKTWWPALLIAVGAALFFTPSDKKKD